MAQTITKNANPSRTERRSIFVEDFIKVCRYVFDEKTVENGVFVPLNNGRIAPAEKERRLKVFTGAFGMDSKDVVYLLVPGKNAGMFADSYSEWRRSFLDGLELCLEARYCVAPTFLLAEAVVKDSGENYNNPMHQMEEDLFNIKEKYRWDLWFEDQRKAISGQA